MQKRISQRLKSFDSTIFRNIFIHQQILNDPINLSVGLPEDPTHEKIKNAGIDAIRNNLTTYTPSNGIPQLRHAIANKLYKENNIMLPANQITIVPGLTTGLLLVYLAIIDPEDEIIVMDPGYPPYNQLAEVMGASVINTPTLPNFQLDLKLIEENINDNTKAIVINSPNNPTGAVYPEKDLQKLAKIAEKHGVLVISDEIYEHFVYDDHKHFSIGSIYPDTITMHGFSKEFSMTGWRLGYISGPYDVIEAINELQQYAIMSSSSIAQYSALEALNLKTHLTTKYQKKRDIVKQGLQEVSIELNGAQGSFFVFFKVPNELTDLEFAEKLLNHNLILVPGRAHSKSHRFMRLSYGAPIDEVKKGISELQKVVRML